MSTISPSTAPPPPTQPSSPPPSPPPGPPPPQSNPTSPALSPPPSQSNSTPPALSPPPSQSPLPIATSPPLSNSTQPPSQSPPPIVTPPPPAEQPLMATPPTAVSPPPQSPASPPPPSLNPQVSSPPPPSSVPTARTPPPPPPGSPPPPSIPPTSSPPPQSPASPSPSSGPPPSLNPSVSSPPPPSSVPASRSPPPPPPSSPPPPSIPPVSSPPPPPNSSPPPPSRIPPPTRSPPPSTSYPPPPVPKPPSHSPPPPGEPPSNPPRPPVSAPPINSTPTPVLNPPPSSPPEKLSPPWRSPVPPGAPTTNSSNINAPGVSGSTGGKGTGTAGIIGFGVIVVLILLSVIGTAALCVWKRKKKASGPNGGHILPTSIGSSPKSDSGLLRVGKSSANTAISSRNDFVHSQVEPGGLGNSRSLFTFDELMAATDGFSAHNLLGEGGFGSVYKGNLLDGREVAVKQLKIGGGQGEREFRAEVEIISRIHHRHLVSLVGYCISDNRRMLIYDYVPNNTLYFHLHGQGRRVMDWAMRVRIAVGAARGLAYLHEDCHPRIIHRDIKSSNILLDNNFEARVSDFGLAKICQDSNTHISTRVMGTFGYMAPEYASSGKLTDKSDVFSFGVVLMELITGRKPVDSSQPLGEESLVEWGRPLLSHAIETEEFDELVDPRLEKNYVDSEMLLLIEVAAACVRHSSAKRPQMRLVVRAFDSLATYDLMNGMRVGESEIFNSSQQSEEIRWFRRMAFGSQNYSTDFFSQGSYR